MDFSSSSSSRQHFTWKNFLPYPYGVYSPHMTRSSPNARYFLHLWHAERLLVAFSTLSSVVSPHSTYSIGAFFAFLRGRTRNALLPPFFRECGCLWLILGPFFEVAVRGAASPMDAQVPLRERAINHIAFCEARAFDAMPLAIRVSWSHCFASVFSHGYRGFYFDFYFFPVLKNATEFPIAVFVLFRRPQKRKGLVQRWI